MSYTYMEIERLVAKAEANNDFSIGYQDGMNRVKKSGTGELYIQGYKLGFKFKGK